MTSRTGAIVRLVALDLVGSVAWFPVWWYLTGLQKVSQGAINAMMYRAQSYAIAIWIRNFFVPMYGQYDWTGRLISVLVRFAVIVGRCIALVVESVIYLAGVVFWAVAPPLFFALAVLNILKGITSGSTLTF